jgi:hypothetical protein
VDVPASLRNDGWFDRRRWLSLIGFDPPELASLLNKERRVRFVMPKDVVPLPLPSFWEHSGDPRIDPGRFFSDRHLLALYVGLMSLPQPTLAYFAANLGFVRELDYDAARRLAAFGSKLRVRDGVVQVPGGAKTAAIWTELVGRSSASPREFISEVLNRHSGRLAWFFAAMDALSPEQLPLVFGHESSPRNIEQAKRVYDVVRTFLPRCLRVCPRAGLGQRCRHVPQMSIATVDRQMPRGR